MSVFQKATKKQAKLRAALAGPSGSGKTFTALTLAQTLGTKIAVIDTEHGSASKYADLFDFDVLELTNFRPANYVRAIKAAQDEGYDTIVIDSMSHEWGACLEMIDEEVARTRAHNSFAAWKVVTPEHNAFIEAIIGSSAHVIGTMRSKTEYVVEQNEKGKAAPKKVGTAPIQRDNVEYEFDFFAEMDRDNTLIVSKTRCADLNGAVVKKPGKELAEQLVAWLSAGAPAEPPPTEPAEAAGTATAVTARKASTPRAATVPDGKQTVAAPPSKAQLAALLDLVAAKGGDVAQTAAGAATAEQQGKLAGWYAKAKEYWEGKPDTAKWEAKIPEKAKAAA